MFGTNYKIFCFPNIILIKNIPTKLFWSICGIIFVFMKQKNILPTFLDFHRILPTKHLETLLIYSLNLIVFVYSLFLNPSSYYSISSAANAFYWAWQKTTQWLDFFLYCSEIKVLVKRKNDSPVNHLSFWVNENMKNKVFLTCLVFKGFVSRNKLFYETKKKNNFKKNFVDSKAKSAKKKQNSCFVFRFSFKTSLRTTSPALAFVFETGNPEVVSCTNEKFFFSLYFSLTRKQSFQQTNCFFLNKTIL